MNIRFKKVTLNNFMSFDYSEIDLQNSGYTLVKGINNNQDDLAKSNGSGKSSIWESIIWCLTGETIRGSKQIVNKFCDGGTSVELEFEVDNDIYKLTRYKDHSEFGTNLKVFINGDDKSGKGIRDTEKLLEQYLPDLNSSLLGSVIILGQGLPQRFTNNTPAGRKEILEKLSKSDYMIEDIKEKLTNRKTFLSKEIREFEDLVLGFENKKLVYVEQQKKLNDTLSSLIPIDWESEISKQESELKQCKINVSEIELKLNQSKQDLEKAREDYLKLDAGYKDYQLDAANKLHNITEPLVQEKIKAKFKSVELNKEIERCKSITDICPTCGQKLPNVHKVDTSELEKEYDALIKLVDELANKVQEEKDRYNKADEAYQIKLNRDKEELEKTGKQFKLNYESLLNDFNKCNSDITARQLNIDRLKVERDTFNSKTTELKQELLTITESIEVVSEKILYNNIEKENRKSRLDIVSKMLTVATREFRGYLLSEIIKFIDQKSKEYALDIFETNKIEFKLESNNINIYYCDKQYESLSGGEKQKIDLIIQFAIRDMLSQFLNFSSNILVLDEIFDNLDSVGCQKVLNLISMKLIDIESVYIITHHTDISIPCDNELVIVKDGNGISKVQGYEKETKD